MVVYLLKIEILFYKLTTTMSNSASSVSSFEDDQFLEIDKTLLDSIQLVKDVFGNDCISYAPLVACNICVVKLMIYSELTNDTYISWELYKDKPIVIVINFECESFAFDDINIKVFQIEDKKNNILQQLQRIIQPYIQNLTKDTNFLSNVYLYCQNRLKTINQYCIICDEKHKYTSLIKPVICNKELCIFSFLNFSKDNNTYIDTMPCVIDLLITMFSIACKSSRRKVILKPYPKLVNPKNNTLEVSNIDVDYDILHNVMMTLPSLNQLIKYNMIELKIELDKINYLSYPLLQWLILSNRSYIVKIQNENMLSMMCTENQYVFLNTLSSIGDEFNKARDLYGSIFAFHGSPMENWYSIIRRGLLKASNTELQLNGAMYGAGIYVSTCSNVSLGYSSGGIRCLALCEIINSPDLHKANSEIWVVKNPNYICTRFLFLYNTSGYFNVNSLDETFVKKVKSIMI